MVDWRSIFIILLGAPWQWYYYLLLSWHMHENGSSKLIYLILLVFTKILKQIHLAWLCYKRTYILLMVVVVSWILCWVLGCISSFLLLLLLQSTALCMLVPCFWMMLFTSNEGNWQKCQNSSHFLWLVFSLKMYIFPCWLLSGLYDKMQHQPSLHLPTFSRNIHASHCIQGCTWVFVSRGWLPPRLKMAHFLFYFLL